MKHRVSLAAPVSFGGFVVKHVSGDPVDRDHHVARHCVPSQLSDGVPTGAAFTLRDSDDGYLSVNWLEGTSQSVDRNSQLREMRASLQRTDRTVRASHRFAVLSVGDVLDISDIHSVQISVEKFPLEGNSGHAGIVMPDPPPEPALATLIALALVDAVQLPTISSGDLDAAAGPQ
jgi:hypothetical protein